MVESEQKFVSFAERKSNRFWAMRPFAPKLKRMESEAWIQVPQGVFEKESLAASLLAGPSKSISMGPPANFVVLRPINFAFGTRLSQNTPIQTSRGSTFRLGIKVVEILLEN